MRGFIVFILTVVMLCIMAPMTVMACGTCDTSPVLAVSMEKWSDVMTAKARGVPDIGTSTSTDSFTSIFSDGARLLITSSGFTDSRHEHIATLYETGTAKGMASKMGGAAILASGQPRFSLLT